MATDIVVDLGALSDRVAKVRELLAVILSKGKRLMATVKELNDDMDAIAVKTVDYIAGRDAIDATKDATIADLMAQLAAGAATAAEVQAGVDAAFAKAEAEKALLTSPVPTPPVDPANP